MSFLRGSYPEWAIELWPCAMVLGVAVWVAIRGLSRDNDRRKP
jgi:hypothetical protein